jgi:radical SAM/Cys-rich protein
MSQPRETLTPFEESLSHSGLAPLMARGISTIQVNLGKKCNQSCRHCHVNAGPGRKEMMGGDILDICLNALKDPDIKAVDITGGAPELHPGYRDFVRRCRAMGKAVLTRCNLTVILENGMGDIPRFFAENSVIVMASLPYYRREETDRMRGPGVFEKSVEVLRRLNAAGYAGEEAGLELNLVYNPAGAFMPPRQGELERVFRDELSKRHGVVFNHLYSITNMPIARFLEYLDASGNYAPYMQKLVNGFNPAAAENVMCRDMVSVGWDGALYDCDFNQMLSLAVNHGAPSHIRDWDAAKLRHREIVTGFHCYGCTAGAGSSCGGETS